MVDAYHCPRTHRYSRTKLETIGREKERKFQCNVSSPNELVFQLRSFDGSRKHKTLTFFSPTSFFFQKIIVKVIIIPGFVLLTRLKTLHCKIRNCFWLVFDPLILLVILEKESFSKVTTHFFSLFFFVLNSRRPSRTFEQEN